MNALKEFGKLDNCEEIHYIGQKYPKCYHEFDKKVISKIKKQLDKLNDDENDEE
jgi:hypothetical protein